MADSAMCRPPMAYGEMTMSAPALCSLSSASALDARATIRRLGFRPRAVRAMCTLSASLPVAATSQYASPTRTDSKS